MKHMQNIPPDTYEDVRHHLKDMISIDLIRSPDSLFSSNIVQWEGNMACVDFRMFNSRTRNDAYILPRFENTLEALSFLNIRFAVHK